METLEIARAVERLIIDACAPLLLYIGYRLFLVGATGQIQLSADVKNRLRAKLTNLSPGALCFVLAVAIGVTSFKRPLHFSSSDSQTIQGTNPTGAGDPISAVSNQPLPTLVKNHHATDGERGAGKTVDIEYLGGKETADVTPLLSQQLERGLSAVLFCQDSPATTDPASCFDSTGWTKKFKKMPAPQDLEQIEALEKRLSRQQTSADSAAYANMKNTYLK